MRAPYARIIKVEEFEEDTVKVKEYNAGFIRNSVIRIVDDSKIRMIQEEIKQNWIDLDKIKSINKSFIMISLLISSVIFALFIRNSISIIVVTEAFSKGRIEAAVWGVSGTLLAGAVLIPLIIKVEDAYNDRKFAYSNSKLLRKKLLQAFMDVEIVSGADSLNEKWKKVSAIDGDDTVKYLVRIIKNEDTGFEEVRIKKIVEG